MIKESETQEKIKALIENGIQNPDELLGLLENLDPISLSRFRRGCGDVDFLKSNIKRFMELEGAKDSIDESLIGELYEKNNSVVRNINFNILNHKYIELLGKDKINLISCYPEIQTQVLVLKDKDLDIFSKCLDSYTEKMQTEEWTMVAKPILYNIVMGEYNSLLSSLELEELTKEDIEKLTQILQENNIFDVKGIEDIRNYEKIREEKLNKKMKNRQATLEDKKDIVIQKIFGHNLEYAQGLIERFGEDIDNIEDGDVKDYIQCLKLMENIEDEETLQNIYEECEFVQIDKASLERTLKNEFGKLFNQGLYSPKTEDLVKGSTNIYEAGTEFKMIMTAVGAFCENNDYNYKESWNRPAISTQHFCTSYIRNDMIGTAEVQSICYGFSEMKEDALMISSNHDVYSNQDGEFVPRAYDKGEKYYTPEQQINHTKRYNEMDFRRVQNGEKKQPDYILVFRENGKIANMEEAQKASEQWGGMPIVIVDKDKCLQSEGKKVKRMVREFKRKPTTEMISEIQQKVRNNRETDEGFCENIDKKIEKMQRYVSSDKADRRRRRQITKMDLAQNYEQVTAIDRNQEVSRIREVYQKIDKVIGGENYER